MGRPWLNVPSADYEGLRPDALSLEVGRNPFERRKRISEKLPAWFPESCLVLLVGNPESGRIRTGKSPCGLVRRE
jgi:hypothetical protein